MRTYIKSLILNLVALGLVWITSCGKDAQNSLNINPPEVIFGKEGGTAPINISTDAPHWNIASDATWLQISQTTGNSGSEVIRLTVSGNTSIGIRSTIITVSAGSAPSVQVIVSQKGTLFPGYNTSPIVPDATGMSSTSMEIANKIKVGLNIGNTLEAIGGETAWGNPQNYQ